MLEAIDYSRSFQYHSAPLLTRSLDQAICVGINLDRHPCYRIETANIPARANHVNHFVVQAFANKSIPELTEEVKKQVDNIESISPKSGIINDLSRFFLGQSLLLHENQEAEFTKHLFLYKSGEIIPADISNALDLTAMVFIEQTDTALPQIAIANLIAEKECNSKKNAIPNKKIPLDNDSLWHKGPISPQKITEININSKTIIDGGKRIKASPTIQVNNYNSLIEYYQDQGKFNGVFKTIAYSNT